MKPGQGSDRYNREFIHAYSKHDGFRPCFAAHARR
jgi:hypothetical protein